MEVQKLFKANKRESAVDIVVNNIKHLLMERKLKPGDRLPSESEISEGMGVSRGSVREAMKILSAFGLVDVKVGNGTYVCEKPGSTLMDSLLLSFFVTNPDPEKLYELRQVIEIDVLEMILRHYDENTAERKAEFTWKTDRQESVTGTVENHRPGIPPSDGKLYKECSDGADLQYCS